AAYREQEDTVGASLISVYNKLNGVETHTSAAPVRYSATELRLLITQQDGKRAPWLPGYRVKILDGNCIEASEHRLKVLREVQAGALPGKFLVVYEPAHGLVSDVFPCEDGHTQERSLLGLLFVLRSRFAEDQLAEAVKAGVGQYVLLGAGLDPFAYRQPAWATTLRIIEVDQPASHAFKRHCLGQAGVAIPGNVAFCPLDFEHTTLQEGLDAVAFDWQMPTFFSWLGV